MWTPEQQVEIDAWYAQLARATDVKKLLYYADRPLHIGDRDPSGLYMSEHDLPSRLAKYNGDHVKIRRIALTDEQVLGLPSFPASDKKKDPRYQWYVSNCSDRCWELDALDPNVLRALVEETIKAEIEPIAWERCAVVNRAEQESLQTILGQWGVPA